MTVLNNAANLQNPQDKRQNWKILKYKQRICNSCLPLWVKLTNSKLLHFLMPEIFLICQNTVKSQISIKKYNMFLILITL